MSPEQWGSDTRVDGRSDQYSLACVLYEMLIGEPPFSGSSPMVVFARHIGETVPSLRVARPNVPEALEQAVFRAMSKVPADRFETMIDFADAITVSLDPGISYGTTDYETRSTGQNRPSRIPTDRSSVATPGLMATGLIDTRAPTAMLQGPSTRKGLPRRLVVAAVASLATVAVIAAGVVTWRTLRTPPPPARTRLLVLPFTNIGPVGDSAFSDGLTEEIISRLSGVPRLGVVARTSAMTYKNTRKTARELGHELNVTKLVQGTVKWKGGEPQQATVSVQMVSLPGETEEPIVDDLDATRLDDLYGIANAVAAKLDVTKGMEDTERARLLAKPTESRAAYEAYQQGNRFYNHSWERSDVEAAIASYERATQQDPHFALAFAALGRAHGWMYQLRYDPSESGLVFAKLAIDSALRLSPNLPEAHLSLGLYYYWAKREYERALSEFEIVRRALPSSAEVFNFIANIQRRKGALKEAAEGYRLSADLDPRAHQTLFNRAEVLLYLRDFEGSERLADHVIELAPDFIDAYLLKASLQIHRTGDVAAARRILATTAERFSRADWRPTGHLWRAGLYRIVDDSLASAERRLVKSMYGLDSGQYFMSKAAMYARFGQSSRAAVYFDSAATLMDLTVKKHPEWGNAFGQLGFSLAGLQRKAEAVRAAEHGLLTMNEKTDALDGPEWVANLAEIYAMVGDVDHALESLTKVLSIPSRLSPKWVELDPIWTPLRRDPRFQKLVREPAALRAGPTQAK
jgi:TolB-like protein